jgi:preprotein translocase subunit SecA
VEKELFDDLIAACNDAIEHEKGNIKLKSNTVTISDEEIERNQLFFRQFDNLSEPNKQKAVKYVNELLHASN